MELLNGQEPWLRQWGVFPLVGKFDCSGSGSLAQVVTPPVLLRGRKPHPCFLNFSRKILNGTVSYAAPVSIVERVFVREDESGSCE